jgi:hypothetical protein
VEQGENINEVEAAGNTPLHSAAYEGWLEGGHAWQHLSSLGDDLSGLVCQAS